jgi:hypothetical protein
MQANKSASADRALQLQPQARVRWFDDTVHDVPLQRPHELSTEICEFVRQIALERTRT